MKTSRPGFKLFSSSLAAVALALLAGSHSAIAAPVVYNFDGFADLTTITNQISGLTFSNATVLQAGGSLNNFEFPPHSGAGVLVDSSGPITINFSTPVFSVGGYFTYINGLTFSAFDAANNLLGSDTANFASNLALSGSPGSSANELFTVSDVSGQIARIVIAGDPFGSSFVLDDLSVEAGSGNAIPEPQTLALMLGALAIGMLPSGWMRRSRFI